MLNVYAFNKKSVESIEARSERETEKSKICLKISTILS